MRAMRSFLFFCFVLCLTCPSLSVSATGITFQLHITSDTPAGEVVCLAGFEGPFPSWGKTHAMVRVGNHDWEVNLDFIKAGDRVGYKYCRNHEVDGADEAWEDLSENRLRHLSVNDPEMTVRDTVKQWRWWPIDGVVPEIDTGNYLSQPPLDLPRRTFQTGVELPDYWRENWLPVVAPTIERIVETCKAGWIQYPPVPEITQLSPMPVITREGHNSTPEADLLQIVNEAHDRGTKVWLRPFAFVQDGSVIDPSPDVHSDAWWRAYHAQWRPIMLYYAELAESHGIEMLGFTMWPKSPSVTEPAVVDSLSLALLEEIRQVYHGLISVEYSPFGKQLAVFGQGDYLGFKVWDFWPWPAGTSKHPTLEQRIDALREGLDGSPKDAWEKWHRPIILSEVAASSYVGAAINDPPWEQQMYYYADDPAVPLDLQGQADAYEAIFQVIAERPWIAGAYSFLYTYWSAIDKTPSVRAKPAEKILAKWFTWLSEEELGKRPLITAMDPESGEPGASVVITGDLLGDATEVFFGDVGAEFAIETDTRIRATVPDAAVTGPVKVVTPTGEATGTHDFDVAFRPPDQAYVLAFTASQESVRNYEETDLLNVGNTFTMEAWVLYEKIEGGDPGLSIWSHNGDWSLGTNYGFYLGGPHNALSFTQTVQGYEGPPEVGAVHYFRWQKWDQWCHLAGVVSENTMTFYMDGVLVGTAPLIQPTSSGPAILQLGGFKGKLRQVRLWRRALSRNEIRAYAHVLLNGQENGLLACWPLDDGEGQRARDIGANKIDLMLGGTDQVEPGDPSWALSEDESPIEPPNGRIVLDLNIEVGDQEMRQGLYPNVGEVFSIDVVAVSGALNQTGFQVKLRYDPAQLAWVDFKTDDLFSAGAYIPTDPSDGVVAISVAILGGKASRDAGSMGKASFRVLDGFAGETQIELIFASYKEPITVDAADATVTIGGQEPPKPTPDFDGDGQVGFTDFIQFADVFGASLGDPKFDARCDLDGDGTIGFTDFLQFAEAFGNPVSDVGKSAQGAKPVGPVSGINGL